MPAIDISYKNARRISFDVYSSRIFTTFVVGPGQISISVDRRSERRAIEFSRISSSEETIFNGLNVFFQLQDNIGIRFKHYFTSLQTLRNIHLGIEFGVPMVFLISCKFWKCPLRFGADVIQ